jgi:hypothetical protein
MRRHFKVKALAASLPLRRAALSAVAASRLSFPAWIAADEGGVSFAARGPVSLRVRDSLVLRKVSRTDRTATPRSSHALRLR